MVAMRAKMIACILASILLSFATAEASLTKTQISQLYVAIFGRASEGEGNQFWQTWKPEGSSEADIVTTATAMLNTDAARNYFGTSLNTDEAFIAHIYWNTLNKDMSTDAEGMAFWVGLLTQGKSRGKVIAMLVDVIKNYAPDGPSYDPNNEATIAAYWQFTNRVTISDYMADTLQDLPDDWGTATRFDLNGLNVTDAAGSVIAARYTIRLMAGDAPSELYIVDYYPQAGPAGSYVRLQLENSVGAPNQLKAYYNDEEIYLSGLSDTVFEIAVPLNAQSGYIELKAGNLAGNPVNFTVEQTTSTLLITQSVQPSSEQQSVSYNDEITVTLPSDFLDETRTLSISGITHAPPTAIQPFASANVYDVSIEGLEQLSDFIEIKVKYDPEQLSPDYAAEDQLMALRWNETEQYWLPLPFQVNTEDQTLRFYTDHLTLVEWLVIGGVAAVSIPVTWAGEKLLNDVYVTPKGNFRFLYSRSAIEESTNFNDPSWAKTTYKSPFYPISAYTSGHPKFIQDVGNLHETALQNYVNTLGFKDPINKPGLLWGTSKNPITVKIDSWWVTLGGDPNYEKIWENIHLPTLYLSDFDSPDFMTYGSIAHELFHRLQAEYYSIRGFSKGANLWWMEACAEYAGFRAAWPGRKLNGNQRDIKADFLRYPINHTGIPTGWGDKEYQYAASVFVQYLVEVKTLDFAQMVAYVASGEPLSRLDGFITEKLGLSLKDVYEQFAAWTAFSMNSFLKKYTLDQIAEKKDAQELATYDILTIEAGGGGNTSVNIYKLGRTGERMPGDGIPDLLGSLKSGDTLDLSGLDGNDSLCFLAVNHGTQDQSTNVTVKIKNKPNADQKSYNFNLKGNYSAKLWVFQIEEAEKLPNGTYNFSGKRRDGVSRSGWIAFNDDGTHTFRVNDADGQVNAGGNGTWMINGTVLSINFNGILSNWVGTVTGDADHFVLNTSAGTNHGTYTFSR